MTMQKPSTEGRIEAQMLEQDQRKEKKAFRIELSKLKEKKDRSNAKVTPR